MIDSLGDRMKLYESVESGRQLMPRLPIVARLDGRAFHTFTQHMTSPYDGSFSQLMKATTIDLVQFTGAVIGYTQSDEITLIMYQPDPRSEPFFGGRVQKLTSILAARASVYFNEKFQSYRMTPGHAMPIFDCRVWNVPDKIEATNVLVWREQDATKNSIQMAAQSEFVPVDLHAKRSEELKAMLMEYRNIDWNTYPDFFKRGTYIQAREQVFKPRAKDLIGLPPKHNAHFDPNFTIKRRVVEALKMPPIATVINRVDVVFDAADPITTEVGRSDCTQPEQEG